MKFLKSKKFWITTAHLGTMGISIALGIIFPPIIPLILATQATINGILPSPIALSKASTKVLDSSVTTKSTGN